MLWFSSFAKIQYTGPAIALSLAIALLAALTLAPVLLYWLRGGGLLAVCAGPHHINGHDREQESLEQLPLAGFWVKVANVVVRYPVAILSLCVLALAPLAVVGARTRSNYSQLADLSDDQPSVQGSRIVPPLFRRGRAQPYAHPGREPTAELPLGRGAESAIAALSRKASVAFPKSPRSVRSRSRSANPVAPLDPTSFMQRFMARTMRAAVDSRYVSITPARPEDRDHISRIDVVFRTDPFSDAALVGAREGLRNSEGGDGNLASPWPGRPRSGCPVATAMLRGSEKGDHGRPTSDVRAGDDRGSIPSSSSCFAVRAFACT